MPANSDEEVIRSVGRETTAHRHEREVVRTVPVAGTRVLCARQRGWSRSVQCLFITAGASPDLLPDARRRYSIHVHDHVS
jgi:hypothetical protein